MIEQILLPAGSYYAADVITAQDFFPFGAPMPGRIYSNTSANDSSYRYGFNDKEEDDDIEDGVQDYGHSI